jgi:hypothetical protein
MKGKLAAADQKHLNTKASIANVAAKVENTRLKNVRELRQAHDVLT